MEKYTILGIFFTGVSLNVVFTNDGHRQLNDLSRVGARVTGRFLFCFYYRSSTYLPVSRKLPRLVELCRG